MTQCTSQIKFLATVMNNVLIPKQIHMMPYTVFPISIEIYNDESDHIHQNGIFNRINGQMFNQPCVGNDFKGQTQHILKDIGHPRAHT